MREKRKAEGAYTHPQFKGRKGIVNFSHISIPKASANRLKSYSRVGNTIVELEAEEDVVQSYFERQGFNSKIKLKEVQNELNFNLNFDFAALEPSLLEEAKELESGSQILTELNFKLAQQLKLELRLGFNLILYGYGSKLKFIDQFISTELRYSNYRVMAIHGYMPNLNPYFILNQLFLLLELKMSCSRTDYNAALNLISDYLEVSDELDKVVVVVHAYDKVTNKNLLQLLFQLVKLPKLGLVLGVDSVGLPTSLNLNLLHNSHFIFRQVTTLQPYIKELKYHSTKKKFGTDSETMKEVEVSAVQHVLKSLPDKTKRIFNNILSWDQGKLYEDQLLKVLKEQILTTNLNTLNASLHEFFDHKVLLVKTDSQGRYFVCNFDVTEVKKALKV